MHRLSGDCTNLGLEECGKEESVIRYFDRFDPGVVGTGGDDQAMLCESIGVSGREPVVAPVEADEWCVAAETVHAGPGHCGHEPLLTDKAAGEAADDEMASVGCRLGVAGIFNPGDVSGEFHDRVLKPATGAQEWLA
jgi:hypothetical protein